LTSTLSGAALARQSALSSKKLTNELKTKDGKPIDLITVDTDSDENISIATSHKIRALPTIIAFKDGKPVDQFVGAIPEEAIKEFIARQ